MESAVVEALADDFKVFSEPYRLAVLDALRPGARHVTAVVRSTALSQVLVSRHLKLLTIAGVVKRRPEGRLVFCGVIDASVFRLLGEAEQLMREARRQQLDTLPRHLGQLQEALAQGRRAFAGLQLADLDGVGLDLSDCDLRGSCLRVGRLGRVILRGAQLGGSSLEQALLWGADLSKTQAQASLWHEADLSGARLKGADFSEALLHHCCLRGVPAAGSHWRRARLVEADFRSGLDQLTDLGGADFREADLSFALFQAAQMAEADLRGSCLYGANLAGADLTGANLEGCDL